MNIFLIKLLGFLIGLFITLFIIDYYDINKLNVETFETKPVIPPPTSNQQPPAIVSDDSQIPYKSFKYMCINTFFDITKIDNKINRWYESDIDKTKLTDTNGKDYFSYDTLINLKANTINDNGAKGADINSIELRGPKSFYFANNLETNELNEFTVIMSIKIKDITAKNNILFELAGNTETINKDKPTYLISIVNINISINKNNNFDFIITIGDSIYAGGINDIEKSTLKNNDFIVIGLIYTSSEITFLINKQMYKYKTKQTFKVKLGSTPALINKQGLMNIHLYSFVYYKTPLPTSEYLLFLKHNYYYLSGLNNAIKKTETAVKPPPEKIPVNNEIDIKLRLLEDKINEKLNKQIEDRIITQSNFVYQKIDPLNIDKIGDNEVNSSLNFMF